MERAKRVGSSCVATSVLLGGLMAVAPAVNAQSTGREEGTESSQSQSAADAPLAFGGSPQLGPGQPVAPPGSAVRPSAAQPSVSQSLTAAPPVASAAAADGPAEVQPAPVAAGPVAVPAAVANTAAPAVAAPPAAAPVVAREDLEVAPPVTPNKFARRGHFAIGAERLMGYFRSRGDVDSEQDGYYFRMDEHNTFFSLLTPANSEYGAEVAGIPRLAADYFVLDQLSLGANLGYATHGGEFDVRSNYTTNGGEPFDNFDLYLAGARVGYMSLLMDGLGVWPRLGYHYSHWSFENSSAETKSFGALHTLNLEALLIVLPSPSWGIHAGVIADISVAGGQSDVQSLGRADYDVSRRTIGVTAGLTGLL